MTDTLAVFVVINASIILYYLLNIEKIKQFLFDRDFPRRILEIFPFFSAIATIVAQYFYIAHYNEPAFVAINAAFQIGRILENCFRNVWCFIVWSTHYMADRNRWHKSIRYGLFLC